MREERLIWAGLAFSAFAHASIFCAGELLCSFGPRPTIGIDLTHELRPGPRRARRGLPARPKQAPAAAAPPQKLSAPMPPDSPLPSLPALPESQPEPSFSDEVRGQAALEGALGGGGEVNDLGRLSRLPRLLNLRELDVILRRCYPVQERRAGRQGTVVLDLSLGADGRMSSVEIVQSAGAAFDEAALRVARFLRYAPAFMGTQPVAVKIRQAIAFKLEA